MALVEKLIGGVLSVLLYILTILTTAGMLGVMPVVLLCTGIAYFRRKRTARSMLLPLGFPLAFIAGGMVGWIFRPFHWNLSFLETLRAQTADHSIEYYAERVLLFVLMTGSLGVWLYGIAALMRARLSVVRRKC